MNVPQLRFNGFEKEWKRTTVSNELSIIDGDRGKNYPNENDYHKEGYCLFLNTKNVTKAGFNFDVKNFIAKEKHLKMSKGTLQRGDIVMTSRGSIGNIALYTSEVPYDVIRINSAMLIARRRNELNDITFIEQLLKSKLINDFVRKSSVGSAQPHITVRDFNKMNMSLPYDVEEQKKIGSFLQLLSQKIEKQKEKISQLEQFKKGMMQKIFSQELRFKNEDGGEFPEWEENIRAKELFKSISNKNHAGDLPVLSASQENGIVLRDSNNIQIQFSIDNLVNYKKVEPNDFVISLRSFQGGIEFSQILGIMSPAYTIFRAFDEAKIYSPYFSFLFKTTDFITKLNNLTYGIRDGKAISFTDFSTMSFNLPSIQEQKKIASYLVSIDKKVRKEKEKLMVLEEQKRGFMQRIFV